MSDERDTKRYYDTGHGRHARVGVFMSRAERAPVAIQEFFSPNRCHQLADT